MPIENNKLLVNVCKAIIDKNKVQTIIRSSRPSIIYAVVSLIINGEGLFENKYSPKKINSIGNRITNAKIFGTKE
jgi:hypothetical protein